MEEKSMLQNIYVKFLKRLIDIVVSSTAIIILLPFFIIIGVLIKAEAKGPILYKQLRIGQNRKEFLIYKFRTMVDRADTIGPTSTATNDGRITNLGKILRKYSIDELPQLFNVLLGEMSLIGFRPGVNADYTDLDEKDIIFRVRPGITGYAQINGRSNISLEDRRMWERKYVQDMSLWVDIGIIIKTIKLVIKNESVV